MRRCVLGGLRDRGGEQSTKFAGKEANGVLYMRRARCLMRPIRSDRVMHVL